MTGSELTESDQEFFWKNRADIWMVFMSFYKKNNVFYQEDMTYIGICSLPIEENIVVNGSPVSVEQVIYIDETPVYLWSVENVDLKTNIQVENVE